MNKKNKQILAVILLLATIFCQVSPAFAAYSTGTYKVNTSSGVNVRNGAGSSYTLVGAAVNGTQFKVSKISGTWGYTSSIKCTNGTQAGWVSLDYCSLVSSGSSSSSGSTTTTTTGYSPAKAIEFAAKYAKSSEVKWLCAEFVSRCLIAGGLDIDNYVGCTSLNKALGKIDGIAKYKLQVENSGAVLESKNKGKIAKGDVIILYCDGCTDGYPYWHTVLVGDITTSGIKVYARNNSYKNELYYGFNQPHCNNSKTTAYCFHFETSPSTSTPTPAAKTTITFSSITAPTTHTKGNSYPLSGTVKSTNSKLTSLTAAIINSSTSKTVVSKTVNPNAYSYTIKDSALDTAMTFGTLAVGSYTLKYTAKTADGTSKSHTSSFTVKAAATSNSGFTSSSYKLTGNQANDVIGVAESKLNCTKADLNYLYDYCAYFVCNVLKVATGVNIPLKGYPDEAVFAALKSSLKGTYYVFEDKQYNHSDLVNSGLKGTSQVKRVNRSSITPQKGDVIIYLWTSDKNNGYTYSHTGFVKSFSNGTVYTIEGNTTSGSKSGVVANKTRSYDSQVVGIYRPAYKTATTPTPSYPKTLSDGVYYIASALDHKKVIDVSNGSLDDKANIHLWDLNTTAAQRFRIKWENGYYTITNVNSNKVLDIDGGSTTSGANVQQYKANNTDAQKWSIVSVGNGYYSVRAKCGLYLDVKASETANGTNVQVYTGNNSKAQMFKFIPEAECTPMPCSITFSPSSLTLYEGETGTVTVNFKGNGIYKLGGSVASSEIMQSAAFVGGIDFTNGIAKLQLTAKKAGTTTATVRLLDSNLNTLYEKSFTITVKSKATPTPKITPTPTPKVTVTPTPTPKVTPKPLSLTFSTNTVVMDSRQTKNVTVSFSGEKVHTLSVKMENSDICNSSVKNISLSNGTATIALNANCAGTSRVTVSLLDSADKVLLEKSFTVTVNPVNVGLGLSPASLNLKTGESKLITINYTGSGIYKLSNHVEDSNICSTTWISAMDGSKSTFRVTATKPGKTAILVSALDANKKIIYQTTLTVTVSNPSTATPTAKATVKPTPTPTVKPTATFKPTVKPTVTPAVKPTVKPTVVGKAQLNLNVSNPYPIVGETITVTVEFNSTIPSINVFELILPIDKESFEIIESSIVGLLDVPNGTTSSATSRNRNSSSEIFYNWVNIDQSISPYSSGIVRFDIKVKKSGTLNINLETSFARDDSDKIIELYSYPVTISPRETSLILNESSDWKIDSLQNYLIISGASQATLLSLLDNFVQSNFVVTDAYGNIITDESDFVGSGFTITALDASGNLTTESLTVIVIGDINGDGKVNSRDIASIQKAVSTGTELLDIKFISADVNSDDRLNSRDVASIQKLIIS